MPPCGCAMMQMYPCRCVVMPMYPCRCAVMQMYPCRCAVMQMYPCRCAVMQTYPCRCAMMQMLWCKHNSFKNSLYFQNEASTTPETKIFSKLDLLFMKSHLPFDLRLPKNWWSLLENLRMGHLLETWWSDSLDLFSQFGWAQEVALFKGPFFFSFFFFEKMNSLKIKHFEKIHYF